MCTSPVRNLIFHFDTANLGKDVKNFDTANLGKDVKRTSEFSPTENPNPQINTFGSKG